MQQHRYDIDGGDIHVIEVGKTTPAAALHQTAQNCLHAVEVGVVRAIADQRKNGKYFGQISDGFRFATSRRTVNRASHLHCQRIRYSHMDFIRQRCDNEASSQPKILITVVNVTGTVFDVQIIRFFEPMEAQLTLPEEVAGIRDLLCDK